MKNSSVLIIALMLSSVACFTDPQPKPETRYARSKIELPAVGVSFKYGQSIEFASCSPAICYGKVDGKAMSVPLTKLQETPPMKGPVYVWDDEQLSGQTPYNIDDYDPKRAMVHLPAVNRWIEVDSTRGQPESEGERESRRKAKEAEEALRVQREKEQEIGQVKEAKEQAKRDKLAQEENRRNAKQAAISEEADRRAFARQLRDNYLSLGSNIKVTVSGAHAERITLEYALIDDVWTYKFQHDAEALGALKAKGFTHLTLSDGFNYGMRITL